MAEKIIGRISEQLILKRLLVSNSAELLAVYGRRRIGKTYLLENFFSEHLVFYCSGENAKGNTQTQLANFADRIRVWFPEQKVIQVPKSWQEAFVVLRECLNTLSTKKKMVLFFDEIPWLETHKSGFLSAFGYFWNMYLSKNKQFLVVVCGSSASWMIKKIVYNKGGLHNRITQKMRLLPFSLKETKDFLIFNRINLPDYQILQLYMVTGGVPAYLKHLRRGYSLNQQIEELCFSPDAFLKGEFTNLFSSLFDNYQKYLQVIYALAKKDKGLTRKELLDLSDVHTGGGLTTLLEDLTECGFIEQLIPYSNKKKDTLYRLIDEFCLFYLNFMQGVRAPGHWSEISRASKYLSWQGYAFENICIRHIDLIKKALGISGIGTFNGSWFKPGSASTEGSQIDLLISRGDLAINVIEVKFSNEEYVINKRYAKSLENKIASLRAEISPRMTVFLNFITTFGVKENQYKDMLVDAAFKMDILFE